MLAKNLQLEQEGVVMRRAVYDKNPRVEYKLYTFSKRIDAKLDAILTGLEKWIDR
jgi:DNA-binding HxlR family transcriptional regulator